jgi:GGDEF domain-containing protein
LDEISKSLHAEFDVEASIGYEVVLCGEKSLNECINNADEKMYQFKKARKAQRK